MSWDSFDKGADGAQGVRFIKLKSGDKIVGIFRGDPHTYYSRFKDQNEYQEWAEGRSFKFRLNFIVFEDGKWTAKILQGGSTLASLIREAKNKYGLKEHAFEISRKGSTKDDTEYFLMYEKQMREEDLKEVDAVKLNALTRGKSVKEDVPPPTEEDRNYEEQEDIPF